MPLFISGHEVFDMIVKIEYGSSILVVDENFSEGKQLIGTLLSSKSSQLRYAEIATKRSGIEGSETFILESESPNYSSVAINNFRNSHRRWVIIHSYLPDFLIRYSSENVLRMIDSWRKKIIEAETVEIFLLPKETFSELERMLRSIVDGIIELSSDPNSHSHFLTPIRCTIPEYDVKRFEYIIHNGRLKIKWGQDFIDSFPYSHELAISQKMKLIESQKLHLKVVKGTKQIIEDVPLRDKLLLSQIINKDVEQILAIFPDKRQSILEKMVEWNTKGIIDFQKINARTSGMIKTKLNLATRLMLALPTRFAALLLAKKSMATRRIPAGAYLLRRSVDEAFYSLLFPQGLPAPHSDLDSIEEFLQDVATRMYTYEVIKRVGEDPRNRLDPKLRPQIIKMMLKAGYSTNAKIKQVGSDSYEIIIDDCPICHGVKSERPTCVSLVGAIIGNAVLCFKSRVTCVETSCKAMGDEACTFYVEFLEDVTEREEDYSVPHRLTEKPMLPEESPASILQRDNIQGKETTSK